MKIININLNQLDNWSFFVSLQGGVWKNNFPLKKSMGLGPALDYRNIEIMTPTYPGWHPDKAPQGETPEVHVAGSFFSLMLTD